MKLLAAAVGGVPGEVIVPIMACDTEGCPCGSGFVGVTSGRLVTVAAVGDLVMATDDLRGIVAAYMTERGWDVNDEMLDDLAEDLQELADWPEGTRITRTGDEVRPE
jgi:hypothetical protein